jgi:hypothetical protein
LIVDGIPDAVDELAVETALERDIGMGDADSAINAMGSASFTALADGAAGASDDAVKL